MSEAESSSSDGSSDLDSSFEDSSSDSDSDSDLSDGPHDRCSYRRSSTRPRQYRQNSPRRGRDDSRTPSPPPRHCTDSPRRRHDDSRSVSPPRSRRDDNGRSGYGRARRESPSPAAGQYRRRSDSFSRTPPRDRWRSPPRRENTRDRDRSRVYDRRRIDSRDRYRVQGSPALMKMSIHSKNLLTVSALCPSVLYVYYRVLENPAPLRAFMRCIIWDTFRSCKVILPRVLIWLLSNSPKALSLSR